MYPKNVIQNQKKLNTFTKRCIYPNKVTKTIEQYFYKNLKNLGI